MVHAVTQGSGRAVRYALLFPSSSWAEEEGYCMRKLRFLIAAGAVVVGLLPIAPAAADPIVCHDYPGGCCQGVNVNGKEIIPIYC